MNIFQRIVRKIRRLALVAWRKREMRRLGISFYPPNFIYRPQFTPESIVIDGGCGYEADFSQHLIKAFGLRSIGIDPTRKHFPLLKKVEEVTSGRFRHHQLVISAQDGWLTFYESGQRESGSLLSTHSNMQRDDVTSYLVESITLSSLIKRIGVDHIDLIKLDLEGAEYDLLRSVKAEDLIPYDQIFIEFHHHAVPQYSMVDTKEAVETLAGFGFKVFSLDNHNYLFYRS